MALGFVGMRSGLLADSFADVTCSVFSTNKVNGKIAKTLTPEGTTRSLLGRHLSGEMLQRLPEGQFTLQDMIFYEESPGVPLAAGDTIAWSDGLTYVVRDVMPRNDQAAFTKYLCKKAQA